MQLRNKVHHEYFALLWTRYLFNNIVYSIEQQTRGTEQNNQLFLSDIHINHDEINHLLTMNDPKSIPLFLNK